MPPSRRPQAPLEINQILEMPGNAQAVAALAKILQSPRKLTIFCGAGISIPYGIPGWSEFLLKLGKKYDIESDIQDRLSLHSFEEAADDIIRAATDFVFQGIIREHFGKHSQNQWKDVTLKPLHRVLPELASGLVLTTNFDSLLEHSFEKAGRKFDDVICGADRKKLQNALQYNSNVLVKLHGDWASSDDRVLTLDEYKRHYGGRSKSAVDFKKPLPQMLKSVLGMRPVLFLGASLGKDRTTRVMAAAALDHTLEHFAIVEAPNNKADFNKRATELGKSRISPIWYPKGRHEAVELLLVHLCPASIQEVRDIRHQPDEATFQKTRPSTGAAPFVTGHNRSQQVDSLEKENERQRQSYAHRAGKALRAYCRTYQEQADNPVRVILERLVLPWNEPISIEEQEFLASENSLLMPEKAYPSPPWVFKEISSNEFPTIRAASMAIRSTARWPDSYRLNFVRQLSTTSMSTALDANHSRLSHCLGTLDMATCLLMHAERSRGAGSLLADKDSIEWVVATLLYAFVHDRYHGPLGHSLDPLAFLILSALGKSDKKAAVFRKLDKQALSSAVEKARWEPSSPLRSVASFAVSATAAASGVHLDVVTTLEKLCSLIPDPPRQFRHPEWRFLVDLIDSEIDADRLDYLWRDALHLRPKSAEIERLLEVLEFPEFSAIGRLLERARVVSMDGTTRVAYHEDDRRSIDALLTLRFHLYLAYYENPEKRTYDEMLSRCIVDSLENAGCVQGGSLNDAEIARSLLQLTDDDLFHFLYEISARTTTRAGTVAERSPEPDYRSNRLLQDVVQARSWARVWSCELTSIAYSEEKTSIAAMGKLVKTMLGANIAGKSSAYDSITARRRLVAAARRPDASIGEVPEALKSPALPVVEFYETYHGTEESLRKFEKALWSYLLLDPAVDSAAAEAWQRIEFDGDPVVTSQDELRLIVLSAVKVELPKLEAVVVYNDNNDVYKLRIASEWQQEIESKISFYCFVAVHPELLCVRDAIKTRIGKWFENFDFLPK